MRKWITRALKWALSIAEVADPRIKKARELVRWAEVEFAGKSGERKRAQVLSRLADEYPDERLRNLSVLIEQAVQEL